MKNKKIRKLMSDKELKRRLVELPEEKDLWIFCFPCGKARYGKTPGVCTVSLQTCDLCKKVLPCTEKRDFLRGEKIK